MPRNNKKNRNRGHAQTQFQAPNGGAQAKNITIVTNPSESDQSETVFSRSVEQAPPEIVKLISNENTETVTVDSLPKVEPENVKVSQSGGESSDKASNSNDEQKCDSNEVEAPFETQTLKKKRNRNRNKKKNGPNAGDSGASSTSATHESSPNHSATVLTESSSTDTNVKEEKTTQEVIEPDEKPKVEEIIEVTPALRQEVKNKDLEKPKKQPNDSKSKNNAKKQTQNEIHETAANQAVVCDVPELEVPLGSNNDCVKVEEVAKSLGKSVKEAKKSPKANKKSNQKDQTAATANKLTPEEVKKLPEKVEIAQISPDIEKIATTSIGEKGNTTIVDKTQETKGETKSIEIVKENDDVTTTLQKSEQQKQPSKESQADSILPKENTLEPSTISQANPNIQMSKPVQNAKNKKSQNNKNKNEPKLEIMPEPRSQPTEQSIQEKSVSIESKSEEAIPSKTKETKVKEEIKVEPPLDTKSDGKLQGSENLNRKNPPKEKSKTEKKGAVKEKIECSTVMTPVVTTAEKEKKSKGDNKGTKTEAIQLKPNEPIAPTSSDHEITKTPTSTPIMTTPAPESSKSALGISQVEDETAKIWKILEEASKSLEPVEIQMDDDPIIVAPKKAEPPPITALPIALSSIDEKETEKAAQNLKTILDTKECAIQSTKSKETEAVESMKPHVSKETQKDRNKSKNSPTKMKQSEDKSAAKSQSRQSKEKEIQTRNEAKVNEQRKLNEAKPVKIEAPPPIIEPTPPADTEIPLDMSIISDIIETPETGTNSKNVQGSDFVPSVEQTADATESLRNETNDKMKTETKQLVADKIKNNAKQSPTKNDDADTKTTKGKTAAQPKSKKPEQIPTTKKSEVSINKAIEKNANGATSKKVSPQPKSANKPSIPPKPDHLVSSNPKKINDRKPNEQDAKLLLGTPAEDEDDNDETYIEYKFMPRQVFIASICQACKKPTAFNERVFCPDCQMVSYCTEEHSVNDQPIHRELCAAIQEIAKKRGGHVYNNSRILNNNDYRSLRVHTLNLCENIVKRPLQTYEREILLFPRLCSLSTCREWHQDQLTDCPNCTQVYYCTSQPDHLDESHQRWCKSIALYKNLVVTQSISGRIEPTLPSRILTKAYTLPSTVDQVFKDLYKNYSAIKDDCVFATVTQLATAPLTAYFAAQQSELKIGEKFTIHLVGAELQFEADILDIWELFFLHLAHKLVELTIVFCGPELNAENIPLDIISRIRMCRTCRQNCRIVKFDFQCAKLYHDYASSNAYKKPDLICFFNPGFHHISYNGMDTWSETIKNTAAAGCPVIVTSYTEYESPRDLDRFQIEMSKIERPLSLIHGPQLNVYASQRPERNFISDEVTPLIFKNFFCFIMK